jgi:hypothetical protein
MSKKKAKAKAAPKVQAKQQPRVQAKIQPIARPKAQPKVQAKVQAKVQPKAQAKVQPKVQPKAQAKAQVSDKKQERKLAIGSAVASIGNKFKKSDYKNLRQAGLKDKVKGNNKILKIAASSKRVGDKASGKLSGLNPGIKLPKVQTPSLSSTGAPNMNNGGQGIMATNLINRQQYKDVGKQIKKAGKQYLQWGGTDAKARPQALGGFKIPKKFRKGSDLSAMKIGQKAYKRGSFSQQDGSGSYLGRGGMDILKKSGKPANKAAAWSPRNQLGKNYSPSDVLGGKRGKSAPSGGRSGGGSGGISMPSSGGISMPSSGGDSSQNTAGGSGIYGGEGTGLNPGAPNFRRRRSRASRSRSNTQGPSRFGTTLLARPSGLNIAR